MAHKPEELQEVLHYTFKNPALLRIALTHTSYANESKVATTHNERLEFLGDSVLSVVVADYLFHQSGRPEGELTRMRASLVSEDALFQFAQEIQLGEYLRLGHGEDLGGGRSRPSVVSDAFEAVIAALYLDGGMEAARNFILPFITEGKTAEDDYKTRLQEVVQQDPSAVLKYEVTGETGPDHNKQFTVCVWRNGELLAEGRGRSKKAAEQHAAKQCQHKDSFLHGRHLLKSSVMIVSTNVVICCEMEKPSSTRNAIMTIMPSDSSTEPMVLRTVN